MTNRLTLVIKVLFMWSKSILSCERMTVTSLLCFLKQNLCNSRRSQGRGRTRDSKFDFEGVFECFLPIFDLGNTILGLFLGVSKSRFGYRGPGVKFQKSSRHPPKPISDCSARRAESTGANIFRIRSS